MTPAFSYKLALNSTYKNNHRYLIPVAESCLSSGQ
jgi:hypothetical protein